MSYFQPPHIIIALDNFTKDAAISLAKQLDPNKCRLKIGKELFTAYGPAIVQSLMELNFDIFLDLKYHDIPNTVSKACAVAAALGVWMVNVHILGGTAMLQAAREAINETTGRKPLLVGVTILTSLNDRDLKELGFQQKISEQTTSLTKLAYEAGLDGVVCSPHEVKFLRQMVDEKFCFVTPGIRLPDSTLDDQKRYLTPEEAFAQGADFLVIGRPITQAPDPAVALDNMLKRLKVEQ